MTQTHIISDSIARIRNSQNVKKNKVQLYYSKLVLDVLKVLKSQGYIVDYKEFLLRKGVKMISVLLKYDRMYSSSSITEIEIISKPGRRVFSRWNKIPSFYEGLGVVILSTSKGVMSDYDAKRCKVGGELICKLF